MAFPIISSLATTNGTIATASPVVNLPGGIVAGNTLLVLIRAAAAGAIGFPAGWTELFDDASDASDDQTALAWRKAVGDEGATITLSSATAKFAAISWHITGAADPTVTPPQFAALVVGTSTTPNPGSLSPTGGAKDYLWLWMGGWEGEQTSPPASNPANYTLADSKLAASTGTAGVVTTNCRVASAGRELNAATEDPGSWTISVSDDWTATVVAVHPVPPPSPTRGLISWVEQEVPFTTTRGLFSWVEAEVPIVSTRGLVSWVECETPLAPTRALISFTEVSVPFQATRGLISQGESEFPLALTRGLISWAETAVPIVTTRGFVSWIELELPLNALATRGLVAWCELETPLSDDAWILELQPPDLSMFPPECAIHKQLAFLRKNKRQWHKQGKSL